MTVYFREIKTKNVTPIEIGGNQRYYASRLIPGTYQAYAWTNGLGAMYSEHALCDYDLGENCTNYELVDFEILPGEITHSIDICDWYAPQEDIPRPPGE